jgi:glutamyl-tRNA reductase
MDIIVVGLSHNTASLDIREMVAFSKNDIEKPLTALVALEGISEVIIISTCNRVEIYASVCDHELGIEAIKKFFSHWHQLPCTVIEPHLYSYHSHAAIRHLFRVASSLDSMIVGEPQILGQIKTSFSYAAEFKTSGIIMNRLLHKAFSVAKRVRTETAIASSAVSIAFAAIERTRNIFETITDKTVMLIGVGEMCELAARHFTAQGVKSILVVNRTLERAISLADLYQGTAYCLSEFEQHLHKADIVLSSVGGSDFLITQKSLEHILPKRRNKPMFLIDLAVPRNIDPSVNELDGIYLCDMDNLQQTIENNLTERKREADKAEKIIAEEVDQFSRWISGLEITPTIVALRHQFEILRQTELDRTLTIWKDAPIDAEQRLNSLTHAIINKILHYPTVTLRECALGDEKQSNLYIDALHSLFDLKPD